MSTKLGTLTLNLVARIGNFTAGMRQASSSAEREMQRASSSVNVMNGMLGKLAATAGAAFSINQIVNYADSYTGLQNRLKLVTASQAELNTAMNDTFTIAQKTASSWDSTAMVYQRFADNADRLGISLGKTAELTETVSKAISVSGGSAASAEAALMQFGQALASGVLRGEEFNSIAEQAPGLLKAIAKGMDVNIGALRAMAADGKITGDVLVDALGKAKPYIDDLFNKTDFTISQSFTKLSNEVTKFVGEFDSATGASKTFVEGITTLSENMEGVVNSMMVGAAFMAGTYIPAIYSTITAGYAKTKQLIDQTAIQYGAINAERAAAASALAQAQAQIVNTRSTLTALAAEKALEVQRLQAQINAAGRMATTTRMAQLRRIEAQATAELVAAETALAAARARSAAAGTASAGVGRAALGVLFGPVGLGIAVASVAAGYLLMRDNGNEANAMLDQQQAYAGMAATELTKLEGAQRRAANESLSLEFETQSSNLKALQKDFTEYLADLTRQYKGVAELERIYGQLRAGTIDVEQAFQMLNQVEAIKTSDINKAADFEKKHKEITSTLSNLKPKLDQVSKSTAQATGEFEKQKTVIEGVKEAYEAYMKTFNADVKEAAASNSLVSNFKLSENEKAEILKVVQAFGYDKAKLQTEEGRKAIDNAVKLAGIRDKQKTTEDRIAETEKKATEQKRLQLEYARKQQIILAGTDERTRNMLKVYQAFMNTGALSDKQARYLTAEVGRENDFKTQNLYGGHIDHNNGAKNLGMLSWQKDRAGSLANSLRSKNLIDSSGNIKQVQEALDAQAAFFVNELFNAKRFAPSKNALLKNADYSELSKTIGKNGIAWDYDGRKINALPHHQKRDGYFGQLNTILGPNPDGMVDSLITSLAKRDDEMYNYAVKIAEDQKEIQERYYTEWQKLEEDNQEKIKEIQEKFANDPAERDRLLSLQQKFYQDDVENWIKTQDEKVETERQANWRILEARYDLLNSSKAMYEKINSLSAGADDIFAQATMSPKAYAEWSLDSQRGKAQVALGNQRIGVEQDIMSSDTYATDEDRYEALQEAYQQYRDGMAAIDVKYYQDLENLQNQSQAASLAGYGAMFGMMGSMLDAYGEKESTAYKLAFAMQKGFVLASAIMNAKGAIMSAWNDPANVTIWQKMAGAAAVAVQTNELMSAIQGVTLTGMAHNGIDSVPQEGTWLLDGGERVINPQQNKDLTRYLNESRESNSSPNVNLNPNFVIVDEREKLGDYLYSPDGKKAFVKFFKQNKRELGFA